MSDLVLDTNILADFVAQYLSDHLRPTPIIVPSRFISQGVAREINRRIAWYSDDWFVLGDADRAPGLIIASVLAFVEIARKFDEIVGGRYTVDQLHAFIHQPPQWFFIAPVDSILVRYLCRVPGFVRTTSDGTLVPVEVADAIHVATALSRDNALIAATDLRIRSIDVLKGNIV